MNRMTRRLIAGTGAAALLASLVACAPQDDGGDTESEIRIAGAIAVGFDPFDFANLFNPTGQAVYDPLIYVPMEGVEAQPWLAESWEIAPDGSSITFFLREDVEFIDGVPFDAPGLEKYLDALFASDGYAWKTRVVDEYGAEATAIDEYTLQITFANRPYSFQWLWQFSLTPIASPAIVDDRSLVADGPVGTGPYTIESEVTGSSISFVRRPGYWDPDAYPYDRVTVTVFNDAVAALNALKTGQIDAAQLDPTLAAEAEQSDLTVTEGPGVVGTLYISDHSGSIVPALGDVRVRQAIAMAFDREAIRDTIGLGYGRVSSQAYDPAAPEYVEGGDDRYPFDLDAALELMAEAGYADGFTVTIPTYAGSGGDFGGNLNTGNLEPIVQTSLAAIGITVEYEPIGGDVSQFVLSAWQSGEFPILMTNMPQTNWTVAFDTGVNWPDHGNAEFAELILRTKQGSPDDQLAAYRGIGEFLLEEAWYVPISRPPAIWASVPEVKVEMSGLYPAPKLAQFTPVG